MTGPVASGLPAFCRVVGSIRPERGSDIGFEVWLPSDRWNGRLYGAGIGGFAGSIDYMALGSAVRGGQVGVATDTGHKSTMQQSGWAKGHPERVRDYGWRAVHLSTITAKALARQFYGRGPDRSYFVGCSGGGRQGLMEAARFPEDYDGIVSSAPAASLTDLTVTMLNSVQAQLPAGAAIRPQQASLIQEEVLKQCDAGDGQVDGLVEDPRQCRFDVAKLACGTSTSPLCLSAPQVSALAKIYAGPRDASGRQLTAAYLPGGSEVGTPFPGGWETYILKGTAPTGGEALAGGFLMDFVQRPFTTPATFDFTKDPQRLKAALSRDLDAPHDLRRFFARGGKLILWHGWADAAIPPEATLRYHAEMLRQSGARAKDAVQLYMVPGVQHCGGGLGATSFGQMGSPQAGDTPARSMVTALRSWVEEDSRPGPLVARRGAGGMFGVPAAVTERQRLLCPWPGRAVLRPGADPDQASSYSCRGGDGAQ
jgi:feruloyl esterase